MKTRSGEHPGCQLLQPLIGGEQRSRFSPGQCQIEAVVDGMIEVAGQGQCFHLQVPVGFDHVHQLCGSAQALLQAIGRQLAGAQGAAGA